MKRIGLMRRVLRPEEAIALAFLPLLLAVLGWCHLSMVWDFQPMLFCSVPAVLISVLVWLTTRSGHQAWRVVRDFLPLVIGVLVYENLHATTGVWHLPDRHAALIAVDEWLCGGVNPVIWAERFIHPRLTALMVAAYSTYYFWPPLLTLLLYRRRLSSEFRDTMLAFVVTMFAGYIGYMLVPALNPWMTLHDRFTVTLRGDPILNTALDLYTTSILKAPRDCFPSLHTAVTLVGLVCAWRWLRPLFWIMLPCAVALLASTIYLRLHYLIDLLAAVPVSLFGLWAAPRLNRWWSNPVNKLKESIEANS